METIIKTKVFGYETEIRSDGKYNVSEILKRYNETSTVKKRMDVFLKSKETERFIGLLNQDGMTDLYELVKEKQEGCRPMKHTWWFDIHLLVSFVTWLDNTVYKNIVKKIADTVSDTPETLFTRLTRVFGIADDTKQQERLAQCLSCAVSGDKNVLWLTLPETKRRELLRLMAEHIGDIENGTLDFESYIGILKDIYFSKQTDGTKKGTDNQ